MSHNLKIRRVLIVDDEIGIREILRDLLLQFNIESDQAENGEQALDLLRKNEYHAVFCDLMMPGMSGFDCLTFAQLEGIVAPFIFVTGYDDSARLLQAIRLGAIDFINKPFDSEEIMDVVFRVMEIGIRRSNIMQKMAADSSTFLNDYLKDEKMISYLRVRNNKRRTK